MTANLLFSELKATLQEHIPNDKTIKYRLEEHYGNDVIISTKSTSQTLVCLRRSHYDILSEMYKQSAVAGNQEEQKLNALKVTADIIRSDIRSMTNYSEQYPASDKMFDNLDAYIPELKIFLEEVILKCKKTNSSSHKIKCTSIGHAIVCAVHPRSFLSPLHVGLAVNGYSVTMDQPLYIKSRDIVAATNLSDTTQVVVRLGFHTILSFLGCVGYIMANSGIKEALSTIYAEKTVDTILSGHAYARAVRAHTLLEVALYTLIFKQLEEEEPEFK
ncbi:hypothetical protein ALC57_01883 [Trachymyrmex cornetzi]|uniref:Uncharacterized protein n=1 Tax=Trachymyrmex cornetzi TaxID=471704 RepID=A0A151JPV1_9HYME|nr:hypothetical protein ALC57_01883 [Trachymyrmex cornetzi]